VNHKNGCKTSLQASSQETSTCSSDISRRCTCYPSISRGSIIITSYLSPNPPEFTPTPRLTQARLDILKINPDGFLWPEEEKLFIMVFRITRRHLLITKKSEVPSDATIFPTTSSLLSNTNRGRTPRTLFLLASCQKLLNLFDPRSTKEFMS